MSTHGIKISLPGYDVKTATPEQCAVHSDYANPKIRTNQTPAHFNTVNYAFSSDPASGTYNLLTIAHGFSYTPAGIAFIIDRQYSPAHSSLAPLYFDASGNHQLIAAYTDSTNLKIDYIVNNNADPTHINVNGFSFTFKYYLLLENAA